MRKAFARSRWSWVLLLCAACAQQPAQPPAAPDATLLRDALFPAAAVPAELAEPFRLSPAMQDFLDRRLAGSQHAAYRAHRLVEALYQNHGLRLNYDASRTRTAAEAFADRAGNCLSLVIMTAAFAHALDLDVEYHAARLAPTWSRRGPLLVASSHVNLTLRAPAADPASGYRHPELTVDFLEPLSAAGLPTEVISEQTVVAMYRNNRAVEALAADQLDQAYAWTRWALQEDPGFSAAYNTLGVIYLHRDVPDAAAPAFRAALRLEPDNPRVLGNLVKALQAQGLDEEAGELAAKLARLDPDPPFHDLELGVAAFERGELRSADTAFRREVARQDDNPEPHYWLARTAWALGEPERAQREIATALRLSTTPPERQRYAAKLDWLRSQASP